MYFFSHSHRLKYITPNNVEHSLFYGEQTDLGRKIISLTFDPETKSHWWAHDVCPKHSLHYCMISVFPDNKHVGRYYYDSHRTDEKTEGLRGSITT